MSRFIERLWYPHPSEPLVTKLLRAPLHVASLGFRAGVAIRNTLYDRQVLRSTRVEGARVISIGNLNVGGAGKTQVVIWLVNALLARGERVAVLSRGYGRQSTQELSFDTRDVHTKLPSPSEAGDEPVLIARRCPGVRLHVGANRRSLAARATAHGATVLVLDDGMQHRRLARDEEWVVLDESVGLGNGALLPAGPLREPPSALRRASLLWLRVAGEGHAVPHALQSEEAQRLPTVRARHAPTELLSPDGTRSPTNDLKGRNVHLLSALARPGAFRRTVESLGARITAETVAPDHHAWTHQELDETVSAARHANAILVTTEKDRVKLPADADVWVLRLGVEILSGQEHLERVLAGRALTG